MASWVLARHGLEVTPASRMRLLKQIAEAALDAGWAMKRAAQGDYTPDLKAIRFPSIEAAKPEPTLTWSTLFERWRAETKPEASTLVTWRSVVKSLRAYLNEDSVARLTAKQVSDWKTN